jgi:cell fate (sporulation/competence/biofilm development) regulator YlbF (YheA/YmcA/DUF963 family)
MCIKIIHADWQKEFDPSFPMEMQLLDANQILVNYDPSESFKLDSFVNEIERMVKTGVSLSADIEVNTSNTMDGMRLKRKIESLKNKIEVNEVIKGLCRFHFELDSKLNQIKEVCSGRINEQ